MRTQGTHPSSVSVVKRQKGILATPAGREMNVSDDGQHAADEHSRASVAFEEAVR